VVHKAASGQGVAQLETASAGKSRSVKSGVGGAIPGRDQKGQFYSPYLFLGSSTLKGIDAGGLEKVDLYSTSEIEDRSYVDLIPDKKGELMLFLHGAENMSAGMNTTNEDAPDRKQWDASELAVELKQRGINPSKFKKIDFFACWTGADKPVDKGDGTIIVNSLAKDFSKLYPNSLVTAPNSPVFYQKTWDVNDDGTISNIKGEAILRFGDVNAEDYYRSPIAAQGVWMKYKNGVQK
jgi:hypothetical protein